MFAHFKKMKVKHQLLTAILIGIAVVSFWRGAWGLMDVYIFPDNYLLSSWISMVAGVVVLIATHYATKELM